MEPSSLDVLSGETEKKGRQEGEEEAREGGREAGRAEPGLRRNTSVFGESDVLR